ncbi:MAG: hypothetical protein HYT73_01445 [Candidatus Aenigmarchaeota archaeon]|nr:hypothetical protein [Candidatus Aenigmarchaeota archaeon]
MKSSYIAVLLLVFAAGCTGLSGVFGGDILNIKQNLIQEGQKDIVVIKDVSTIPKSPMLPEQSFVLTMLLENIDKTEDARNVVVDLFNAPTVKKDDEPNKGNVCNAGSGSVCIPDKCSSEGCLMLPGEQIPINFYLKTPTEDEIVGIETKPSLDYRVTYDFESSSLYVMPSVNLDEIIKNQRSNDKVNVQVTKSYGTGPVRIDMELFGTPYILSGQSATFIFKITNTGRGNVIGSQIDAGNFEVSIPKSLIGSGSLELPGGGAIEPGRYTQTTERFSCTDDTTYVTCTNTDAIQLYKDQTRGSLRFEVKGVADINQPFISYDIRASVKYRYELRGTQEITVKPFES